MSLTDSFGGDGTIDVTLGDKPFILVVLDGVGESGDPRIILASGGGIQLPDAPEYLDEISAYLKIARDQATSQHHTHNHEQQKPAGFVPKIATPKQFGFGQH